MTRWAAALSAPARITAPAVLVLGIEYARVVAARTRGLELAALLLGGLALCAVCAVPAARTWRAGAAGTEWADELGLGVLARPSRGRVAGVILGGVALGVVLLLPAAVRWQGGPVLSAPWSLAAVAVSVGEEVAFRGVLFAAIERHFGGAAAVLGTTLVWTAAHALSHPLPFLVPVAAAGLLLGLWRWVCRDVTAPVIGHVLADLAL